MAMSSLLQIGILFALLLLGFYHKLGFRPVLPEVVRLSAREEGRMLKKPGYRTPAATLRRLAGGPLIFEMEGAPRGDWDRFSVRNIDNVVARANQVPSSGAVLGWS